MKSWKTPKGTELLIMDMRGKDYLEVKWRLVWFREEHPDWSIETEFLSVDPASSFAKATIRNVEGRILATGHKFEDKAGFADHKEKAETGAIGRALALIGYGTQFCGDDLDEGERLADAPVDRSKEPSTGFDWQRPGPEDGYRNMDASVYKVPFGKWRTYTLESIPLDQMRSYVLYLEKTAEKAGKPLGAEAQDFINRAEVYIGAIENADVR